MALKKKKKATQQRPFLSHNVNLQVPLLVSFYVKACTPVTKVVSNKAISGRKPAEALIRDYVVLITRSLRNYSHLVGESLLQKGPDEVLQE